MSSITAHASPNLFRPGVAGLHWHSHQGCAQALRRVAEKERDSRQSSCVSGTERVGAWAMKRRGWSSLRPSRDGQS